MLAAADLEINKYMAQGRIEEVMRLAELMGCQRLGLTFCVGLEQEARVIGKTFSAHFKLDPVCRKVCAIEKGRAWAPPPGREKV